MNLRVVSIKVLQPAIQPFKNVVQPLDEFRPVRSHLHSTKVLPDRGLHFIETIGDVRRGSVGVVEQVGVMG